MQKLERKSCDLIVVNGPEAIHAAETRVEILGKNGHALGQLFGRRRATSPGAYSTLSSGS